VSFRDGFPFGIAWAVRRWWLDLRFSWRGTDKEPWIFGLIVCLIATVFGLALRIVFAHQDDRRNLVCLARNVYFEARGEPAAGQYAVAEVTMNRAASGRFPATVCDVVYQKKWDPLRNRYVGAFSWTELDWAPIPDGEEWQQAWKVAEAVYYRRSPPVLEDALFYHAAYIKPDWARQKRVVARIGNHIFYR
jgi:N-acetylmuramoyl-L-alanine amidase